MKLNFVTPYLWALAALVFLSIIYRLLAKSWVQPPCAILDINALKLGYRVRTDFYDHGHL